MKENESLRISFNGDNSIELSTLTESLNSMLKCLEIIAKNTLSQDDYCKFIVNNVEKGSFIIDIAVIKEISDKFIPLTVGILTIAKYIFELRKFLKGKKPKLINKENDNIITITNYDGEKQQITNNVYNIYTKDNEIEKQLAHLSEVVSKSEGRTSLIIEGKEGDKIIDKVIYNKEDLCDTKVPLDVEEFSSEAEESVSEVTLKIKKMYFLGEAKWDFIILLGNNIQISAEIEDKEFLEKVQKGTIVVSANMRIRVILKNRRKINLNGDIIGKSTYKIIKVLDINIPKK